MGILGKQYTVSWIVIGGTSNSTNYCAEAGNPQPWENEKTVTNLPRGPNGTPLACLSASPSVLPNKDQRNRMSQAWSTSTDKKFPHTAKPRKPLNPSKSSSRTRPTCPPKNLPWTRLRIERSKNRTSAWKCLSNRTPPTATNKPPEICNPAIWLASFRWAKLHFDGLRRLE